MTAPLSASMQQLLECELALLHQDHLRSPEALQQMLAEDFREITTAGTESSRQQVINWLLQKSPDARWQLSNLQLVHASQSLRVLSYHACQTVPAKPQSRGAQHLSVWRFNEDLQCWQLGFHQSTRVS